ncbi:MAG: hypothetical protein K9J13_03890, partial [Saprospiraceae bacterium]|nr:hypothetical protein [Saprospiraceae bacterium]
MKKLLIIPLIVLFFISSDLNATCRNGGEITWECTSSGNFRFIFKFYRECYNANGSACQLGNSQTLSSNVPGFSSIGLTILAAYPIDISPKCNPNSSFSHIYCNNTNPMPNSAPNLGAIQVYVYTSDYYYPNGVPLTGVPPASGWRFYWNTCCRKASTNIVSEPSQRIIAIMYPYNNQDVSICFDNSPSFIETPQTVLCTGTPFTYNHLAFDVDMDSLVHSWGQPLLSTGAPLTQYVTGYSWNSPFPGPLHNSNNVAATINSRTGEISLTNYTSGAFIINIKVTAFKCGIKVAEIWRDFQVAFTSCGTNNSPVVIPPFQDSSGQFTLYVDTVYAGQLVNFNITATDIEFLPNGTPQTIAVEVSGNQFGDILNTSPSSM